MVIPDSVQAVIATRLRGLNNSQQSLLQTASVVGREFKMNIITAVHPAPELLVNVDTDLQELMRKRIIERVVGEEEGKRNVELQFAHKFVQEAVYESALVSTRTLIHRNIGRFLETDESDSITSHYSVIAHHFTESEDWRSACHYWMMAGDLAIKSCDEHSAINCFNTFLVLREKVNTVEGINSRFLTSDQEEAYVRKQLSAAYFTRHGEDDLDSSLAEALKALRLLKMKFPKSNFAKYRSILTNYLRLQSRARWDSESRNESDFGLTAEDGNIGGRKGMGGTKFGDKNHDEFCLISDRICYQCLWQVFLVQFRNGVQIDYIYAALGLFEVARRVDLHIFCESLRLLLVVAQSQHWGKVAEYALNKVTSISHSHGVADDRVLSHCDFVAGYVYGAKKDFRAAADCFDRSKEVSTLFWLVCCLFIVHTHTNPHTHTNSTTGTART